MEDLACAVLKQMYTPDEPHDFKILVVTGENTRRHPLSIVMKIQAFKNLEHIIVQWGLLHDESFGNQREDKFVCESPFAADEMNLLATQMSEDIFKIGSNYELHVLESDKTWDKFCMPMCLLACNFCNVPGTTKNSPETTQKIGEMTKNLTKFLHLYLRMRKATKPNKEDV